MTSAHELRLYNSLTRRIEAFRTIEPGFVGMYSCGPTVYDYAHLGNLRAYVFTDTLARTLRGRGYALTHVLNITDVGHLQSDGDTGADKMEAQAERTGRDIWSIAKHFTDAFRNDLNRLNITEPDRMPLATDHVEQMIAFGKAIAERHCYLLDSGLYFDVSTVPDYGRLARGRDDAGESRIDPVAGKRNAQDFAIWRRSAPGENRQMEWDSPWGRGAPGWHIECSVMSQAYLGERFDIHTGGIDHREIHHPNEIAQNQARRACPEDSGYTGANFWMHNNFLVERTGKMSKSSGEFLTLQTLVGRGFHPLAYRLMCLQAHYRAEMEFSWNGVAAAAVRLKRMVRVMEDARARASATVDGKEPSPLLRRRLDEFDAAMCDDLATPRALVALDAAISDRDVDPRQLLAAVARMDAVLGLRLASFRRADLRVQPLDARLDGEQVENRLAERRDARAARDFARSDAIRDELGAAGVEVMDGDPLGWDWKPRA